MARMFIGGELADAVSGETYDVVNPATGEVVDSVPKGNEEDVQRAVDSAHEAFSGWADTAAEARAHLILKGIDLVMAEIDDLSVTLTKEQGKHDCCNFCHWFSSRWRNNYCK